MYSRPDPRPLDQRMYDFVRVWLYIVGLSVGLAVWALIAWAAIGNTYITYPDYALPNPIPASQPYNTVGTYQRLQR